MNAGSVVGIPRGGGNNQPYHIQKNLFEHFPFTGSGDGKTLGVGTYAQVRLLAPKSHYCGTFITFNYYPQMKFRAR